MGGCEGEGVHQKIGGWCEEVGVERRVCSGGCEMEGVKWRMGGYKEEGVKSGV